MKEKVPRSEKELQALCYRWFCENYPSIRRCLFHVPNGELRNKVVASQLKAMGVTAGVPDLLFIHKGRLYGIELKFGKNNLSNEQKKTINQWEGQGVNTVVIRSLIDFKEFIHSILLS